MMRLFSRFYPVYMRSLVYMLQATEYDLPAFFAWHSRISDFRTVEKRKTIEWTLKARILFAYAWIVSAALALIAIIVIFSLPLFYAVIAAAILIVMNAYLLPYALAALVWILQQIQIPIEARAVKKAAATLRRHRGLKIAIAGSYGKTTMREILKTVLSTGKNVAAPPGSYNTPLGIAAFVRTLIGDEDVIVFELGEYYPGDVRRLAEMIDPAIGIITGVNEAHLEKFGTIKATSETIFELADYLGESPVYVNADNTVVRDRAKASSLHFSKTGVVDWEVSGAKTSLEGTAFTLRRGAIEIHCHSKLLGLHMIGSIAAAAHIAQRLGLTVDQIERGVANTQPFVHRLEPKTLSEGVTLLDDSYNGNPDGAKAVIEFLGSLPGRRFYVTPGLVEMGARTVAVHEAIGAQLAGAGIEHVVLIRNSVTPYIAAGLEKAVFKGTLVWYEDGPQAFAALPHMTVPGDVVLIQNDWPDQYA